MYIDLTPNGEDGAVGVPRARKKPFGHAWRHPQPEGNAGAALSSERKIHPQQTASHSIRQRAFWIRVVGVGWERFRLMFGLDYRSMALCRIMLGLSILGDLMDRSRDLSVHYTDDGILPRGLAMQLFQNHYAFSIYNAAGGLYAVSFLFLLHALCALSFLLGWRTRLSSVLLWCFDLGLFHRNSLLSHGGDDFLKLVLFWAMWLPMGESYSLDAVLASRSSCSSSSSSSSSSSCSSSSSSSSFSSSSSPPQLKATSNNHKEEDATNTKQQKTEEPKKKDYIYFSAATFALVLQIAFLYSFSYVHKTGAAWTKDGTATLLALQLKYFYMPMGSFFLWLNDVLGTFWTPFGSFSLLSHLTFAVLYWEGFGPLCFFSPVWTQPLRLFGAVGFIAMHLGLAICLRLGFFFWVCFSTLLILLPSWFWDDLVLPRLRTRERLALRIVYPAHCRFCQSLLRFFSAFFLLPETTLRKASCHHRQHQHLFNIDKVKADSDEDDEEEYEEYREEKEEEEDEEEEEDFWCEQWKVIDSNGTVHRGFDAFVAILRYSFVPMSSFFVFVIQRTNLKVMAERIYNELVLDLHDTFCEHQHNLHSYPLMLQTYNRKRQQQQQQNEASEQEEEAKEDKDSVLMISNEQEHMYNRRNIAKKKRTYRRQRQKDNSWAVMLSPEERLRIWALSFFISLVKNMLYTTIILFFLFMSFGWCMLNVQKAEWAVAIEEWKPLAMTFGIHQNWGMFAPSPPDSNFWFAIKVTIRNGTTYDLFGAGEKGGVWTDWSALRPYSEEPIEPFHSPFKNHRWYKFWEAATRHESVRRRFLQVMCQRWKRWQPLKLRRDVQEMELVQITEYADGRRRKASLGTMACIVSGRH